MAGLLSDILWFVDRAKQSAKANVGLLVSDPKEYFATMAGDAREFNRLSELAVQGDLNRMRGLPVTPDQAAAKKYVNSVTENVAMGFAGTTKVGKTPFELAHETAQANAVKMLGLPPGNTAMDRAKALGLDMEGFHATGADIRKIDPEIVAKSDYGTIGQGFYIDPSKNAAYSNLVAKINQAKSPQNIMPVRFKSENLYDMTGMIGPTSAEGSKRLTANIKDAGFSGTFTYLPSGAINEVAIFDPSIVRSRFAAFDPARVNEPDLLAAGIPLGLIANTEIDIPKPTKKKKAK